MTRTQFNVRLPGMTTEQIELLQQTYGLTQVQVVILAIDKLTRELNPERGNPDTIRAAKDFADSKLFTRQEQSND